MELHYFGDGSRGVPEMLMQLHEMFSGAAESGEVTPPGIE